MGYIERQKIYKSIVSMRKKPLIAYVTSIRPNLSGHMAGDAISPIIEQINKIPKSYNLCRAFNPLGSFVVSYSSFYFDSEKVS